ncbi:MAG: hypothetical protein MUC63_02045 [Planctomycetes bacterium]|nr:hypothetical protein [Planctomycetota bacterium]
MKRAIWILSRLEENPAGERRPGEAAVRLAALAAEDGTEARILDPLDADFLPRDGAAWAFTDDDAPRPSLAVSLLDPLRPAVDLLFLEALRDARVACRNGLRALRNFRDPLRPYLELGQARVPHVPVALVRRPRSADRLAREIGFPVELRLPGPGGGVERVRFDDLGSLRGALDLLWRTDLPVVAAAAPPPGREDRWVAFAGSTFDGKPDPLALRAARALDLDFGCVRVREEAGGPAVAELLPFPAPPGEAPALEILEDIADMAFEP